MMPESAALSMWPADTVSLVPGFRTLLAVLWPCDELTRAEGRLVFYCFSFPVSLRVADYSRPVHSQCSLGAGSEPLGLFVAGSSSSPSRAQLLPPVNIRPQRAEAPPYTHA